MSADASLDHPKWTIQSERDVQLMDQIDLSNPAERVSKMHTPEAGL
jgi:hypothetical protein